MKRNAAPGLALAFALAVAPLHAEPVTALGFSPDGNRLAVGVARQLRLVPTRTNTPPGAPATLDLPLPKFTSLQFAPDGRTLFAAGGVPGESGLAVRLDTTSFQTVARFEFPDDVVQAVAVSPDGSQVALASLAAVHLRKADPARDPADTAARPLAGHTGRVLALAFSPDGSLLVSTATDRSVKVWKTSDGTLVRSFGHHTEAPHAVAFRPGTGPLTCATAGDDRTVRVWQPALGRMVRIIRNHGGPILALQYATDDSTLFSAGTEGVVRRIDADSDTVLGSWQASTDWIHCLAVNPRTGDVATGAADGTVALWSAAGSALGTLTAPPPAAPGR